MFHCISIKASLCGPHKGMTSPLKSQSGSLSHKQTHREPGCIWSRCQQTESDDGICPDLCSNDQYWHQNKCSQTSSSRPKSEPTPLFFCLFTYFSRTLSLSSSIPVPTIAPGNVQAEAVNSTTIRFTWTAPNPQFINGINQGYKVSKLPRCRRCEPSPPMTDLSEVDL